MPAASGTVNRPGALAARRVLRWLLRPAFALGGFRVEGAARLPRRCQPMILASNHAAFIDSVLMILALRPRFTVCGAKPKYFSSAKKRALMALANILRVEHREGFLRDCRELLAQGEILLIYPEMGRFPEGLAPFKSWAAEVALESRVPILPCYLYGTTQGQAGPKRLVVGAALEPAGTPEALTASLRQAILALAPASSRPEGAAA